MMKKDLPHRFHKQKTWIIRCHLKRKSPISVSLSGFQISWGVLEGSNALDIRRFIHKLLQAGQPQGDEDATGNVFASGRPFDAVDFCDLSDA